MAAEKYVTLNRTFFAKTMPADMKRVFMMVIQHADILPNDQKLFLCDHIHNYEVIGDFARGELLDVLDGLQLFAIAENNISG